MIWLQLIAVELGAAVLLLTVLVAAEVYNSIEFRKHRQETSGGGLGGLKFVEMVGAPPGALKESKEGEDKEEGEEGQGQYL